MQWCSIAEATERLTYAHDRKLLAEGAGARVTVYLVRHARAGIPQPLEGRRRAAPAVEGRARRRPTASPSGWRDDGDHRVCRSPYVRCVRPSSRSPSSSASTSRPSDALAEGAPLAEALRLFEKVQDEKSVLCTHGDVMQATSSTTSDATASKLRDHRMEKGSIWVFDIEDDEVAPAPVRPATRPKPPTGAPTLHRSFTGRSVPGRSSRRGPPVRWAPCASS